jgi:hypothetical protein
MPFFPRWSSHAASLWWTSTSRSKRPIFVSEPKARSTTSSIRDRSTSANRSANSIANQ